MEPLVCCVGDLVEDIVVRTATLLVRGADVTAHIERHRGGSAANTAATVAQLGGRARFVGQVGGDETGNRLAAELVAAGVECVGPRGGVTGTVVVVVEPDGERTMFSDRGAAAAFADADGRCRVARRRRGRPRALLRDRGRARERRGAVPARRSTRARHDRVDGPFQRGARRRPLRAARARGRTRHRVLQRRRSGRARPRRARSPRSRASSS